MTLGRWFDPISERWIEAHPSSAKMRSGEGSAEPALKLDNSDVQRIWRALVDCCARD